MRISKATLLFLAPLLIVSVAALAAEKPNDHGPTTFVPISNGALAVGDDCTDPIVIGALPYDVTLQTNCGAGNNYSETCLGSYDGGEDVFYELTVAATTYVDVTVDPGATTYVGVGIFDACPPAATCVAFAIVGVSDGSVELTGVELAAGTYYIMVDTWPSPDCVPEFSLTVVEGDPPPTPPANDLCDDAEILPLGAYSIDGDTSLANADYSPTVVGCTQYSQALGKDVVYATCLADGDMFDVVMTTTSGYDASIYLVADCADIDGSCVAGGDDPESFSYQNTTGSDQQLYLIVDAWSSGEGEFNISGVNGSNCETVATEETNWGSLKGMYR